MSKRQTRRRFWAENGLAVLAATLALASLVQPEWVEAALGLDPDAGSGAVEWAVTILATAIALLLAWLARVEWILGRVGSKIEGDLGRNGGTRRFNDEPWK